MDLLAPYSQSEHNCYTRCPRRHLYTYHDGIETLSNGPMQEGTFIHHCIADPYMTWQHITNPVARPKDYVEIAADNITRLGYDYKGKHFDLNLDQEALTRCKSVAEYYIERYFESDMKEYEVIEVEKTKTIEIMGEPFEMTMDLVMLHKPTHSVHVFDHKTIAGYVDGADDGMQMDPQFMLYEEGANVLYGELGKVFTIKDIITRDVPPGYGYREIRMNKDGSEAKNNATRDPEKYLRRTLPHFHSARERRNALKEYLAVRKRARFDIEIEGRSAYYRAVEQFGADTCPKCSHYVRCGRDLLEGD